jgi:hypothetical protein
MHQGDVSVYVKNLDLISLRQQYKYMENERKNNRNRERELLVDALKLTGIGRRDRIPNYRGIFQRGPD